jgi:Kef-type K+ transport system membrane component KefB
MEMGALIAGVSIAAFPYGNDVISKLGGVRDFFVTLFFVALGMKIHVAGRGNSWNFCIPSGLHFANRLLTIVPVSLMLGNGLRGGVITALNLSQISDSPWLSWLWELATATLTQACLHLCSQR